MTRRVAVSWSGGKDIAYATYELMNMDDVDIVTLVTTVNQANDRSSMHGVRRSLYERQAGEIGLPIDIVELPPEPSNEVYEEVMAGTYQRLSDRGVDTLVFGDLHLEDIRAYREEQLADTTLEGWWPVWGRGTSAFVECVIEVGFTPVVTAVEGSSLEYTFAGRRLDRMFIDELPDGVDPAGEEGEYHTFVTDGPIFENPVEVTRGRIVSRPVGETRMHYRDLIDVAHQTPD